MNPIDADLWNHAYRAISASRARYRARIDGGRGFPAADAFTLERHRDTWPSLSIDDASDANTPDFLWVYTDEYLPANFPLLFQPEPEIDAFGRYVGTRSDLAGSVLPPEEFSGETGARPGPHHFLNRLTLGVAARCEALGLPDDPEVTLAVYGQVERACLADTLIADVVVPVLMVDFGGDDVIELSRDVVIEPLGEEFQLARLPHLVREHFNSPQLRMAATHALVVRDVELDNRSPWQWRVNGDLGRPDVEKHVARAFRALRVLTGTPVGYADVYLRPQDWADDWHGRMPPVMGLYQARQFPPWLDGDPVALAKRSVRPGLRKTLPTLYAALGTENARLNVAAKRLEMARLRLDHDDEVIDACIGLEALLGDSHTEITHRLAQRAAVLLHNRRNPAATIHAAVKDVYRYRSQVVHGSGGGKDPEIRVDDRRIPLCEAAMALLRAVIWKVARNPVDSRPDKLDAALLDLLGPGPATGGAADVGGGWLLD